MKKIACLCLVFFFLSCGKESPYPNAISDFRPELQVHLKKLAQEKQLPSKDTIARNYIKDHCTKAELLQLLNCEDPVLRVIAYRTIVNRNEEDSFEILLGHLSDTTKVTWWYFEDAGDNFMVSDLLIRKAEDGNKLTQKQKDILIDSVLLKHPYLETSIWMISEIEPKEKYYAVIKEKAKRKTDRCGYQLGTCYGLSKFKKKEDLPFLYGVFKNLESPCEDWIFKAIEENPDPVYYPLLEKYFKTVLQKKKQTGSDELKYYCRAIAAYQNEKSLSLLKEILKKSNYPDTWFFRYNEEFVFKAIHQHHSPLYDDLYQTLKPKMSDYIMKYLDKPDYSERKTWQL